MVLARHYRLALVFITPLALTITAASNPAGKWSTAGERLVDTIAGALIAFLHQNRWGGEDTRMQ